jgi:hypothetical protein
MLCRQGREPEWAFVSTMLSEAVPVHLPIGMTSGTARFGASLEPEGEETGRHVPIATASKQRRNVQSARVVFQSVDIAEVFVALRVPFR